MLGAFFLVCSQKLQMCVRCQIDSIIEWSFVEALQLPSNNLGTICDAVISKVEDWGSKVEKQLKLQPGTFLSVKQFKEDRQIC
jgi:hypothetical protein